MLGRWNYENYTKAIVPLVLALGAFLVGWVSNGEFNRVELGNVIWLVIGAVLVFLAPNGSVAKEREHLPNDPNHQQGPVPSGPPSGLQISAGEPTARPRARRKPPAQEK